MGSHPVRRARAMVGRKATCLPAGPDARRLDRRVGQVSSAASSHPSSSSISGSLSSSKGRSANPSNSLGNRSGTPVLLSESSDDATTGGSVTQGKPLPSLGSPAVLGTDRNASSGFGPVSYTHLRAH